MIGLLHILLVLSSIYVILFTYNKLLIKLVIIIILTTALIWDIYRECPLYKCCDGNDPFIKPIYEFTRSPNGKYIPHIIFMGGTIIGLMKL
jgi:hypothetical protein